MTLAKFLRARIAEDRERAEAQQELDKRHDRRPEDWARYIVDPVIGPFGGQSPLRNVATGLYVARYSDPAWVLAECEAKRRIVEMHRNCGSGIGYCDDGGHGYDGGGCGTLTFLALPYADHSDYDESWRP